jgi:hypothetical protein
MNSSIWPTWALRGVMALVLVAAFVWEGWMGLTAVIGVLVMWALVQFTRTLKVLQRAALQPKAQIQSAVMLHARLQKKNELVTSVKDCRVFGRGAQPGTSTARDFLLA